MVGLNLVLHINEQTAKDLAVEGLEMTHQPAHDVLHRMVKVEGRHGQGAGAGFYQYLPDGSKHLWPGLWDLYPPGEDRLTQQEMIDRMMFVQVLETVRCYKEGVVTSVADANVGSIFGWGFAPFKGGTLQYVNDYGLPAFVQRCRELAAKYGERFAAPDLLVEMAAGAKAF
jgi:3-hydroxyacyl-CoA dehydrogenase/enoyl-CoA hydratase/3-hydroxybutyryl-CoA epimerase